MALNGSGTVGTIQCTIVGVGSSVSGSGNKLTLTLNISFGGTFAGNRVFYLAARDAAEHKLRLAGHGDLDDAL